MPGGSSVRLLLSRSLKATRNKIEKYSGLAQSYAPLPIATRALIPTRRTKRSHGQIKEKTIAQAHPYSRGSIQLHLAGPG